MKPLRGIVPAIITPFDDDERIDYAMWRTHIDRLLASGVHGLFVMGGQGEFFALTSEERQVAARFCAQEVAGRAPVFVNVGSVSTRQTIDLAQKAEADGVDFLVVVTPYYIKPSADELAEHYIDVCRSVHAPVLAYNIPERTGIELTAEILARVAAQCENFVGIKDSSGDIELISAFHQAGLTVFVGRDQLIFEGLKRGAVGAVSACANVAPRAFVDLFEAFQTGDLERAERVQFLLDPLRRVFGLGTFPSVVKEVMNLAGMRAGACRRPVDPPAAAAREEFASVLEGLRANGYLPIAGAQAT